MTDPGYSQKLAELEECHEALCRRCGSCCGLFDGDPCENLKEGGPGLYYCSIYDNRFGTHKTVSGKTFTCVPIRELLKFDLPYNKCAYSL